MSIATPPPPPPGPLPGSKPATGPPEVSSPRRSRTGLIACLVIVVLGSGALLVTAVGAGFYFYRFRSSPERALEELRDASFAPGTERLAELAERAGLPGIASSIPDSTPLDLPTASARHLVPLGSPLVVVDGAGGIRVSDGEEQSAPLPDVEDVMSFAAYVIAGRPDAIFLLLGERDAPWREVDAILDALSRARVRGVILLADHPPGAPDEEAFPALPGGLFLVKSSPSPWSWPDPVPGWFRPPPQAVTEVPAPSDGEPGRRAPEPPPARAPTPRPSLQTARSAEPGVAEPQPPEAIAPSATAPAEPVSVTSGVTRPEAIEAPKPSYTEAARRARIQGVVVLQLVVEPDGSVSRAKVLKGLPMGLSEEALKAVEQWRFKPATRDGEPVAAYWNLTVNFQL